jgi:hypothetical protein
MQRDDSLLLDMLQAARQILEYTNGLQEPDFLSSRRDQDAVLLQFTVLGETANIVKVPRSDAELRSENHDLRSFGTAESRAEASNRRRMDFPIRGAQGVRTAAPRTTTDHFGLAR